MIGDRLGDAVLPWRFVCFVCFVVSGFYQLGTTERTEYTERTDAKRGSYVFIASTISRTA